MKIRDSAFTKNAFLKIRTFTCLAWDATAHVHISDSAFIKYALSHARRVVDTSNESNDISCSKCTITVSKWPFVFQKETTR